MITGKNIIGFSTSGLGKPDCTGIGAKESGHAFFTATQDEIDLALTKAQSAFREYRHFSGARKAAFLRAIAEEVEGLGNTLVETVMTESGLPEGRVVGERGRTCGQLRLFADLVEEGSWVEATIDHGNPDRQPVPKPDVRKMLVALGPVVVFTASNFPLAFSTAGGDTASALAAGCPVVVKGHEAHPATNELVATAIQRAAQQTGMPDGVFSSLIGGHMVGRQLVQHPMVKAVAFTGSQRGGKALFDLANGRTEPIPVFAEMGSINPMVILPDTLRKNGTILAPQMAGSLSLGAGQFCTNPGLILAPDTDGLPAFESAFADALAATQAQCMLSRGIFNRYNELKKEFLEESGVEAVFVGEEADVLHIRPTLAKTTAEKFLTNRSLHEEVFGPFSLLVVYRDQEELLEVLAALDGQLTASVFGEADELAAARDLYPVLAEKAGRLIINGVPTGVEVCHAMQHGGPFPATTDSRFTSVGTGAIKRFARPVAWQDFPQNLLPDALKNENVLSIWRTVNGKLEV